MQAKKDANPVLSALLDTEEVERRYNCSLFYVPSDSAYLADIITLWDVTRRNVAKGSVEVKL